jgi:predicted AAA+ superfamily ATPase
MEEFLSLINSWWREGKISEEKALPYKRKIFEAVLKTFNEYRQILILSGLRRVGKSTIMFQLIDHLLRKGENPNKILYFSFDRWKEEDLIKILDAFRSVTSVNWEREKIFVFLDEIQKLKGWSLQLKQLYDNFPKIKFVVSGSASLELEKEAKDNLAGRYFLKEIPPLSLKEFFELKYGKNIDNVQIFKRELKFELKEYLKKPFPEIVKWNDFSRIVEYIGEIVVSKIIKSDLPDIFEDVDSNLLEELVEIFFSNPGMILNIDSLSSTLKKRKEEISKHVFYLEFSKLIRVVKNFRPSAMLASRKLRKVYPYIPAFIFIFKPFPDMGKVFETFVAQQLNTKYYWREKDREIDFILKENGEIVPVEVKSEEEVKNLDTISYFMEKFEVKKARLFYNGETRKTENIEAINFLDLALGTY